MNSRTLVNIFLLLLLTAMAGFYYYKQTAVTGQPRLTQLDVNQVNLIRIPRKQQDIIFRKQQNGWVMESPYSITAHDFRINTLLGLTQSVISKSYPADELKLEDYALAPPRARIIFNDTEIAYGKTSPVNAQRYLLTGSRLFLLDDKTYPLVSAQPTAFIDLHLIPANTQLLSIHFGTYSIEKTPDGTWKVLGDHIFTADQVQALLQNWQHAQAFAVHAYLARNNSQPVKLQLKHGTIEFDASTEGSWLILSRKDIGIEYHLDASLKDKLFGDSDA